jgi:hypothetical protein
MPALLLAAALAAVQAAVPARARGAGWPRAITSGRAPLTVRAGDGRVECIVKARRPLFHPAAGGRYDLLDEVLWLSGMRLEGPWTPPGPLPRAVSQVLDDPQWADLKKASSTAPAVTFHPKPAVRWWT